MGLVTTNLTGVWERLTAGRMRDNSVELEIEDGEEKRLLAGEALRRAPATV
jgi:hypothetical protein